MKPALRVLRALVAAESVAARLVPLVRAALVRGGVANPDADVVETIATTGAGYRKGPAGDPPFPIAFDADHAVADGFVERWVTGGRPLIDLVMHHATVRSKVDQNLELLGIAGVGETARETLTRLSLGSWDPAAHEHARRNLIPGLLVGYFNAGRD